AHLRLHWWWRNPPRPCFRPDARQNLERQRTRRCELQLCLAQCKLEVWVGRKRRRREAAALLDRLLGDLVPGATRAAEGDRHVERYDECRKSEAKRRAARDGIPESCVHKAKRHLVRHEHVLDAVIAAARGLESRHLPVVVDHDLPSRQENHPNFCWRG